ncbi:oncoprotein-induced transcript 3 protein-like [Engraulis encrasicolus]|uniref:oncoprotein-induced transcript 3 protein-like n=1 Tax=Engraulis encrasicolus TaxID=184585 RepID=UPI002FD780DE
MSSEVLTSVFVVPPSPVSASTPDPSDPCSSYSVLNATWRATTNRDANPLRCDSDVQWQGWYLLVHGEHSVRMAESCVPTYSCGTAAPLWLHGSHPTPEDGIVTRQVCLSYRGVCCFPLSVPVPAIQVKACPGNYTVYKFLNPLYCHVAYCADLSLKGFLPRTISNWSSEALSTATSPPAPLNNSYAFLPRSPPPPTADHVVGMRLTVSSAEHLNETAVEEQILKPLRDLLRERGVDVSGIRLRRFYQTEP